MQAHYLKFKFLMQNLKFLLSIQRKSKKNIRGRRFLHYWLELTLRDESNINSIEGYDKDIDQFFYLATTYLLYKEAFTDDYKIGMLGRLDSIRENSYEAYEKNKKEIQEIENKSLKNPKIVKIISDYQLFSSYLFSDHPTDDHKLYFLEKSKKINPKVEPINEKTSKKLIVSAKKEIRTILKKIKQKHSFKLDVSSKQITTIATSLSATLVFTGFIYNKYLLGYFGVEVARYFTLSDYLASSIEGVSHGALAALFSLVAFFSGFHYSSSTTKYEDEELGKEWLFVLASAYLSSLILVVIFFVMSPEDRVYLFLYVPMMCAVFLLSDWISYRYFKDPTSALFVLVFFGLFSTNIYISASTEIQKIEYAKTKDKKYNFNITNASNDERIIITSNSNYFFIKNITTNNIEIHKADNINNITVAPTNDKATGLLSALKVIWSIVEKNDQTKSEGSDSEQLHKSKDAATPPKPSLLSE
jgi:hypothetical protein